MGNNLATLTTLDGDRVTVRRDDQRITITTEVVDHRGSVTAETSLTLNSSTATDLATTLWLLAT